MNIEIQTKDKTWKFEKVNEIQQFPDDDSCRVVIYVSYIGQYEGDRALIEEKIEIWETPELLITK